MEKKGSLEGETETDVFYTRSQSWRRERSPGAVFLLFPQKESMSKKYLFFFSLSFVSREEEEEEAIEREKELGMHLKLDMPLLFSMPSLTFRVCVSIIVCMCLSLLSLWLTHGKQRKYKE